MRYIVLIAATALLTGCAADGGLAGKGKPINEAQTIKGVCESIAKLDAAFQGLAAAKPGIIGANGMNIEGGVVAQFYERQKDGSLVPTEICKAPYKPDYLSQAIRAAVTITSLLTTWQ